MNEEDRQKSLARVTNMTPLPRLYRCACGLLRVVDVPCEQCMQPSPGVGAASRYLLGGARRR